MADEKNKILRDLCNAFLLLDAEQEVFNFLQDLCTPVERTAMSERWLICKALSEGLSYREISNKYGVSLTTIGRVARFLNHEPHKGYRALQEKINRGV